MTSTEQDFYGQTEARFNKNEVSLGDVGRTTPPQSYVDASSSGGFTWQHSSSRKKWRIIAVVLTIIVIVLLGVTIGVLVKLAFDGELNNDPSTGKNQQTTSKSSTSSTLYTTPTTSTETPATSSKTSTTSTETPAATPINPSTTTISTTPHSTTPTHTPDYTSEAGDPKTCKELRRRGMTTNGIYMLKPLKYQMAIEALCDMETDGGGWTLVASIHESDIRRKCYSDDLWSGYVPDSQIRYSGQTNWDNEMTFGNVHTCTETDYKNAVYYTANASDVMIWHVQTGMPSIIMRDRATLRYRTTSKFLQKYGGNLKELYENHYPLTVDQSRVNRTTRVLDALEKKTSQIRAQIPNWYDYSYPGGRTYGINGDDMYSWGNYLYFGSGRQGFGYLYYEQEYSLSVSKTTINSRKSLPYIMAGVIANEEKMSEYFYIQSYSYLRDSRTNAITHSNTTTLGNFKIQYQLVQFYSRSAPTPCEFYFVVSNKEDWGSVEPNNFRRSSTWYWSNYRRSRYQIEGNPSHVVFGYMLLARQSGLNITKNETIEQANNVARVVLESMSNLKDLFKENLDESVQVPVTFDEGSIKDIMNIVPPNYENYVKPGYLQFRANNFVGYPNALCAGISVQSISPEYLCVGGISNDVSDHGTCGDFAGWAGREDDTILTHQPSGSAHSHKDLFSTLLIFYR